MDTVKPELPTPRFDLLTIEEAAPLVRKSEAAMRWWIRQKSCPIKVAKIGGRLFIRSSDIASYIDTQFEASA